MALTQNHQFNAGVLPPCVKSGWHFRSRDHTLGTRSALDIFRTAGPLIQRPQSLFHSVRGNPRSNINPRSIFRQGLVFGQQSQPWMKADGPVWPWDWDLSWVRWSVNWIGPQYDLDAKHGRTFHGLLHFVTLCRLEVRSDFSSSSYTSDKTRQISSL